MGKLFSQLKPEVWVMLGGGVLFTSIILVAMVPGDLDVDVATARSGPAQNQAHLHRQVQTGAAVKAKTDSGIAPVNAPLNQPGMAAVQWTQPAQAQTVRQLQPFKMATTEPYQGTVSQIINRDPGGWGQIHLMLQRGGQRQEVSLAPEWYLSFQGCKFSNGQRVEGKGFRFDKVRPDSLIYARHVTVNGVRCRLRSIEGLALWGDQLR
ncbi:MAG: hypothetical protein HON68_09805 [Gammaproteobacteria bacterium]|jgi:hypothetical protein|nr:hypothetical protein [Gammaproteobacteria bacterium]MBT3488895.1 hypothetical protein [Gammaproteobacteria bacterium]MBT3718558.1 hypothetical protein [Gammaproteobacteria bacterium]MBT3844473.1 hypothetical protein [Gammaproteobacteria bacterium]MBT3891927.1 hypothetical protein [Gammaproteobacteria bacterium]